MIATQRQNKTILTQPINNYLHLKFSNPVVDEMNKKSDSGEFPKLKSNNFHPSKSNNYIYNSTVHHQIAAKNSDDDDDDEEEKIIAFGKHGNCQTQGGNGGGRSSMTRSSSNASGGIHPQQQQPHLPSVPTSNSHNVLTNSIQKPSAESSHSPNQDPNKGQRTSQSYGISGNPKQPSSSRNNGNIRRSSTWEGVLNQLATDQAFRAPATNGTNTPRKTGAGPPSLSRNGTLIGSSINLSSSTTPRSQAHFQNGVMRRPPVMRPLKEGVVDEYDGSVQQQIMTATANAELVQRIKSWLDNLPDDLERPMTPVIVEDEPRPLEATFTFVHHER